MKKSWLVLFSAVFLLLFGACSDMRTPDDMQMDIYLGAHKELKLLHINASNSEKENQIRKIYEAVADAYPTDKPMEFFAFYPDYTIEVDDLDAPDADQRIKVVFDVNGDRLEFYHTDEASEEPDEAPVIYRSNMSVDEFKTYLHWDLR